KRFVERLVAWWEESGAASRFSLLFRPHPRDRDWRERFAPASSREGVALQEPSFTDLETLAILLEHGDCVVTNAGTILLDALVNDRPTAEQCSRGEQHEGRRDRQREMRVGEEAEGVEDDHEHRRQPQGEQRLRATWPAPYQPDQPKNDPDDRAWKPARELVEPQRQL